VISYADALGIIQATIAPLGVRQVPLAAAAGAVSGAPLPSLLNVPDFDNAAMDGIALLAATAHGAAETSPIALTLRGQVRAGDPPGQAAGGPVEIMTGAPLPTDCDAVIPFEALARRPASGGPVQVNVQPQPGQNVRRAGEDMLRGDLAVPAGTRLMAQHLMALAAAGYDSVPVRTPPRVAVLTTGSELTGAGAPTGSGQIRDANGPYLGAALPAFGGTLAALRSAGDALDGLVAGIAALASDADLVLTTGGVSAGSADLVPAAVAALGGELLFHKVAMRPGKPVLFARLPDGTCVIGLPGNPIAVVVGLRFLVSPALRAMQGLPAEHLYPARAQGRMRKRAGLRFFGKGRATVTPEGRIEVGLLPGQESFRIRPLVDANCWVVLDEATDSLPPGGMLEIAPLYPGSAEFNAPG
jgi:molybdopterin molybdotransferase